MSTARAKRLGAGVKASPGGEPDQRQSAAMRSLSPDRRLRVPVGLPHRRAGRSWNLSKYDDDCVRWKRHLLLLELIK